MEASTHSSAPIKDVSSVEKRMELVKQMRAHEVVVAELRSISSSRGVYQKHGNIFFRTTAQKAKASEQKLLDITREKIQKLNSP